MDEIKEECGVYGMFATEKCDVVSPAYYALYALQHRGQDSCGIVVNDDGVFTTHKDEGLVSEVFTPDKMLKLGEGNMAVGHVRYGTADSKGRANALPLVVNHIKGRMALSFNGSIINAYELREELELNGSIFHTNNDSEIVSHVIIKERLTAPSIEQAVNAAMSRLKGSYSLIVMSPSKLIAARDEHGFHPLCYGRREDGSYVVASESCALDVTGAKLIRDLEPGEILVFDKDGVRSIKDHCGKQPQSFCVFEYIYTARPDSIIQGTCVHTARVRAGEFLAKEHPVEADIVIGAPDSGLDAAVGYSKQSGIPYDLGFLKNKYIGRTFILPTQKAREDMVKIKLNPIADTVRGKRVVLVDDSIVRGTTSKRVVKLLREAGATEVHMRISSPPFTDPCYYGTDIASKDKLISNNHTVEEIADIIGVDSLGYLSVDNLSQLAHDGNCKGLCTACFTGKYPTEPPAHSKKAKYDGKISERGNK